MAESTDQLPDETRTRLTAAVNCVIHGIPYTTAKDFRPDYPDLKYDVLVNAVKEMIGNMPITKPQYNGSHDRTTRVVVRYAIPRTTANVVVLDMRDFLHTNVNPYNWTKKDVHYRRLHNELFQSLQYRESSELFWFEAEGKRNGYLESIEGLQPVLRELLDTHSTDEDIVINLQTLLRRTMHYYKDHHESTEEPPPEVIQDHHESIP